MPDLYAMYGKLAEERETALEAWHKTLAVLRDMKAGKLSIDDIEMTETGYYVKPASSNQSN